MAGLQEENVSAFTDMGFPREKVVCPESFSLAALMLIPFQIAVLKKLNCQSYKRLEYLDVS